MDHEDDANEDIEQPIELQDGDVLRFPPQVGPNGMTFIWEIEAATGSRGEQLAKAQAEALSDLAAYLAQKQDEEQGSLEKTDEKS